MGILKTVGNIYFVYQFLKKLVTPFEKTKAFALGIIDEKGKLLKRKRDLETQEEKDSYTNSFSSSPKIFPRIHQRLSPKAATAVRSRHFSCVEATN